MQTPVVRPRLFPSTNPAVAVLDCSAAAAKMSSVTVGLRRSLLLAAIVCLSAGRSAETGLGRQVRMRIRALAQTLRGGCDSGTPPPLAEECRAPAQHTVGSNVVDNDWRGLRDEPPPSAGSVAAWQWACCVSGEEDDDGEHLVVERSEWWLRAFCCFFCGKWQLMKARRLARLEESQREQEAVHEIARLFSKVFAIDDGLDLGALLRGAQQGARLCLCVQSTNESFVAVYTYVSLYMCISRCV